MIMWKCFMEKASSGPGACCHIHGRISAPAIAMVRPSGIGMQYTLHWTFWKTIRTRPGTRLRT